MIVSGSHTNTNTAQGGGASFETKHNYTLQKTFALEADFAPDQVRRFLEGNLVFKSDMFDQ